MKIYNGIKGHVDDFVKGNIHFKYEEFKNIQNNFINFVDQLKYHSFDSLCFWLLNDSF